MKKDDADVTADQSSGGMIVQGSGAQVRMSDQSVTTASQLIEHETDKMFAFWGEHPFDVFVGLGFLLLAGFLWRKTVLDKVRLKHDLDGERHAPAPVDRHRSHATHVTPSRSDRNEH